MIATTLRGLLARKRRLLATTTAVVLGVAFLVATLTVGDTMRAGFAQGFAEVYAGVDVTVRSTVTVGSEPEVRDVVDADVIASLTELDGVAAVVPVVEGIGTIVGADGNRIGGGGPRPSPPTGSTIRPSTPIASPRAERPAARARS